MENRIKVGVRVRPMSRNEVDSGANAALKVDNENVVSIHAPGRRNTFEFDWSFDEKSSQASVYHAMCKPMIENIFEGFNATFFACKPTLQQHWKTTSF